eukprot:TRINITY_DN1477_c0_g1_i1.p1 TRINITY_DN1477_c0_g1~~TRINITY_DN1477_c0_g1_i1.p1  ORF type:complete len:510 (+),score=76.30 TRINITY_DN1477_c0_g1_i1:1201-2730(+)
MGLVDLGCALFQVSGLEFLEAEAASPEMEQKKKDNGGGFLGLRSTASGSQTCDNVSGFVSPSVNGLGLTDPSQKSEQKGAEDCNIELKLGKRAFYGVAVKPAPGQQASSSAVSCAQNQSKKSRALAHVSQTPKCQVEGCDKELSSAKDYHKRHKVCEAHSKTPQVRVNGIDQRFCQQCSRFHELKEFDEGKRSCRRRLKGHNERRRKPQPFPTGLNPARLPFALPDNRYSSVLADRPFFIHSRFGTNPVVQDLGDYKSEVSKRNWPRVIKSEDVNYEQLHIPGIEQHSYTTSGKLLTFLQGSKNSYSEQIPNHQVYSQYNIHSNSSDSPVAQALSLSSSPGTVISASEVTCALQSFSGVSDSGRALSLLSASHSQPWASRASTSDTLNMPTQASIAADQIMHQNQSTLMQGLQQSYDLVQDKILSISPQPQPPANLVSSGFSRDSVPKEQVAGDATSSDVPCTINLMGRRNSTANESLLAGGHGNNPFTVCEAARPYDSSSMFYPQQML